MHFGWWQLYLQLRNKMKTARQYKKFDRMMRKLLSVPHREIKTKLDAEKKGRKRKKARRSSASREASDRR